MNPGPDYRLAVATPVNSDNIDVPANMAEGTHFLAITKYHPCIRNQC